MRIILLTQGKQALVDDEDSDLVSGRRWRAMRDDARWYAVNGQGPVVLMHRLILPVSVGVQVDHVNGDGLDNRRANLRPATGSQNQGNQAKTRGVSRYKGVTWDRDRQKWQAQIGRPRIFLGRFELEEEAALAYDRAALAKWGTFARLNFPGR